MDMKKLIGDPESTSAPMEDVRHSVPTRRDPASLRRLNTDLPRQHRLPSQSPVRPRVVHPSSNQSRGFWSTVMDASSTSGASSTTSASASASASASSSSGTRTSITTSSFHAHFGAPNPQATLRVASSITPLRGLQSYHQGSTAIARTQDISDHISRLLYCKFCDLECNSAKELQSHIRRAHKEQVQAQARYQCETCEHRFSQRSHLNQHVKTVHAGIRPYRCPECFKAFGKRSDLKSHISSVHENERPWGCEYCPRRFAKKSNLNRHREKLHAEHMM